MPEFTFHLLSEDKSELAAARVAVSGLAEARRRASLHLIASPKFDCVEVREGRHLLFVMHRDEFCDEDPGPWMVPVGTITALRHQPQTLAHAV